MGWTVLRLSATSSWCLGHLGPCSSELCWQQAVLGFLQYSLDQCLFYPLRLGKDCIRQDDRMICLSDTVAMWKRNWRGIVEHSLLSRTWLIHLCMYAYLCVCVCSHVNIHTPVYVDAKGKSQVSSSGMSSPHLRLGLSLDLNLPVRLDCLTNEPQEFCRLPLPSTGIVSMYHHVQHLI